MVFGKKTCALVPDSLNPTWPCPLSMKGYGWCDTPVPNPPMARLVDSPLTMLTTTRGSSNQSSRDITFIYVITPKCTYIGRAVLMFVFLMGTAACRILVCTPETYAQQITGTTENCQRSKPSVASYAS